MIDEKYYRGDDLPVIKVSDYITEIKLVNIDKVEEITLSQKEIEDFVDESGIVISQGLANDKEKMNSILKRKLENLGLIEKDKIVFKSANFDVDSFKLASKEREETLFKRHEEFLEEMNKEHQLDRFPEAVVSKIHTQAYEKGHSSGLGEVANAYHPFVEIAEAYWEAVIT